MSNEEKLTKVGINWYPGHMEKAKREIKEKMPLIDLVFEVIDSRMPISSKIKDIDSIIKNLPRILIMTKYDICDQVETDKFIKYYSDMGYVVIPLDLMHDNKNIDQVVKKSQEIIKVMNDERIKKGLKPRAGRALVIGVPNVGKSTFINRLIGKKKAQTGNRPGITKALGWIRVNNNLELLDTPGILWPKIENAEEGYHLAGLSSIKEEVVDKADLGIYLLKKLYELYPQYLEKRYGISSISNNITDTLDIIAKKRGALMKGGAVDYDKVYLIILQDIKEGYIGNITLDRI